MAIILVARKKYHVLNFLELTKPGSSEIVKLRVAVFEDNHCFFFVR